jgi:SAM-dependent methyltransferase
MRYRGPGLDLLRTLKRNARRARERLVWGGELREQILLRLLGRHYESVFRREWTFGGPLPHFENHRVEAFRFGFGETAMAPEYFYRGFLSAEILRPQDVVLDIGCGDGFFTKRFLAVRAKHVDGIDIEPSAVAEAIRSNGAPNIRYEVRDAVNQPFPSSRYAAVVWDGAIAHFASEHATAMLGKIAASLDRGGVFVGSESLGPEGHDHLQVFETAKDLAALFLPFWRHVLIREIRYPLVGGFIRREAYWRCGNDPERFDSVSWPNFSLVGSSEGRPLSSGVAPMATESDPSGR